MNHTDEHGHATALLSTGSLRNTKVVDTAGVTLGKLDEIMLDVDRGEVAYAVLSFGGVLGLGEKHFAVPWKALEIDTIDHRIVLDVDRERLENAPGFDRDDWPTKADETWLSDTYKQYGATNEPKHGDTRTHGDTRLHGATGQQDPRLHGDAGLQSHTGLHGETRAHGDTGMHDDTRACGDTGMHGATGTDADTRKHDEDHDDDRHADGDTPLVGTGRR